MRQAPRSTENPAMTRKYPLPRGQPPLFAGSDGRTDGADAPLLKKITIRVPIELAGRARSVWRLESAQPDAPFRTYSELISDWIEAGVTEAEQRLNGGRPLTPTPAGQIPRGRPPVQSN